MRAYRRGARAFAVVVASFAGVAVAAPRVQAATVTFDYVLDASDPLTAGPCDPASSASFHYRVATFSVDVSGDYTFVDLFDPGDGYIGIYDGTFDPADP